MNATPATQTARRENLALLYQGLFTGIVRIQAGKQQIANADAFRRRMKEALSEVSREAIKRNYAVEHTMETDFAMVAFLDEVILTSHDPCRNDWAQKPLQEELFGVSIAGELFFTRAEKLLNRPETAELADMLEVYYLCILLGFEGKYVVGSKAELQILADKIRQRIESIRGRDVTLSPNALLPHQVVVAPPKDIWVTRLRLAAAAAGASAVLLFILFAVHLLVKGTGVREVLAKNLFM